MATYNPNIHNRQSTRLKGYNYGQAGLYFITLNVKNRHHLFGHVANGEMVLNPYGQIAHKQWANTQNLRSNVRLHEYIIMPDHIHGIIEILYDLTKGEDVGDKGEDGSKEGGGKVESRFDPTTTPFRSPSQTIGSIIRGYKNATIKQIKDYIRDLEDDGKGEGDKGVSRYAPDDYPKTIPDTGESRFAQTTEQIKSLNYKIWQRNYHDRIIWDERAYGNISSYIINNPKKWDEENFYKT